MDPNAVLVILKVLDIASALAARIGERNAANDAFVEKVRRIITENDGRPTDADFAELLSGGDAVTSSLEDILEQKDSVE